MGPTMPASKLLVVVKISTKPDIIRGRPTESRIFLRLQGRLQSQPGSALKLQAAEVEPRCQEDIGRAALRLWLVGIPDLRMSH